MPLLMKDYYTTWVHQIKTPLSVMQMMVQSEDTEQNRAMAAELFRMEQYVEMALGYVRLGEDASDIVIKECDLDELIRASVRRFASQFIAKKLTFSYEREGDGRDRRQMVLLHARAAAL